MATQSMTGFGKAQFNAGGNSINIEIKCLNSKQQDLSFRISSKFKPLELELRTQVMNALHRDKIEVSIYTDQNTEHKAQKINEEIFNQYLTQITNITGKAIDSELISATLKLPDVFSAEKDELEDQEAEEIKVHLAEALKQVIEFRTSEGKNLEEDLRLRIENIQNGLEEAAALDSVRTEKIKSRLQQAVQEIKESALDQNRFEQELIYYLEKIDITEEKVRLKSHLDYFSETLGMDGSKGKKLGFIAQEMGREINTMGSKANDSDLQKIVVGMKDELEKIKEQLLNLL